jgi:type I restriction enzyme S subunit
MTAGNPALRGGGIGRRLAPYVTYKPSGVEWLGDIPEQWQVTPLKRAARYWVSNVDKVPDDTEVPVRLCNYTDVYYNDHITPDMGLMETTATPVEIQRFGLNVDDIVITKDSEEWSDIAVPALVIESAPDLVCGYHLAIIRPERSSLVGRFLLRACQADVVNQQFQVAATGVTRYGLPKSSIGEAWLPIPPLPDQRAITDFLDRETARIDTLVAKNRTLIERLKEKRTALISRTVTRGLPPDAARAAGLDPRPKLKPSGIDWLGDVPEHWNVRRIATESTKITNGFVGPTRDILVDDGVRYLQSLHIKDNRVVFARPYFVEKQWSDEHSKSILQADDVLIVQTGDIGQVAVVPEEFAGANCHALIIVAPRRDHLSGAFLSQFLNSSFGFDELKRIQTGALHPHLNCGLVRDVRVPSPPLAEQLAIVGFLSHETAAIDAMVNKVETAIERLLEYRTALITAAVTGKIDVREAVE